MSSPSSKYSTLKQTDKTTSQKGNTPAYSTLNQSTRINEKNTTYMNQTQTSSPKTSVSNPMYGAPITTNGIYNNLPTQTNQNSTEQSSNPPNNYLNVSKQKNRQNSRYMNPSNLPLNKKTQGEYMNVTNSSQLATNTQGEYMNMNVNTSTQSTTNKNNNNYLEVSPSKPDTLYKEQTISEDKGKSISNGIEKFIPSRDINIEDDKIADILQDAIERNKLKEIYEDNDNNYLVRIFNYFIHQKFTAAYDNFQQPTSEEIEEIIKTITDEKKNKVIFVKSKLYLYDIDYYIQQYIEKKLKPNKNKTGEDNEINEINKNYANFFSYQNQPNLSFNYQIKFKVQYDNKYDNAQYIDMYSSLLLNKKAKDFKNNETISTGGGKDLIYNLSNKNDKSKIKTKVKNSIDTDKSYDKYWKTLKNEANPINEKTLFTINENFTPPNDTTYSMTSKKVRNYLLKCEDLQIFYINKHILIYELMKKLSDLVKYNKTMCEQINNLTSPTIFINKKNTSVNVELKNLITDISEKNEYDKSSIEMINKMMSSDGKSVIEPIKLTDLPENKTDNFLTLKEAEVSEQWFDGTKKIEDFGKNVYLIDDDDNKQKKEVTMEELMEHLKTKADKPFYIKFGDKLKNFKDYMFKNNSGKQNIKLTYNNNNENTNTNTISGEVKINYKKGYIKIINKNFDNFKSISNDSIITNINFDNLKSISNDAIKITDFTIKINNLKKYIIKIKNNSIFKHISSGKTIYYKSPNTDQSTKQDELLMTYKMSSTKPPTSHFENINIITESGKNKYNQVDTICKNFKPEFLEKEGTFNTVRYYIDSIASFNTLQYIKQLQDNNYASLLSILGTKSGDKYNIDQQIEAYKTQTEKGVVDKFKTKGNTNSSEAKIVREEEDDDDDADKWQDFDFEKNNNNKPIKQYFRNKLLELNDGEEINDGDHLQQVIYRCYDLQVLYMIKHLEVIYINNIIYYYMDMLSKQVSVMLFILSLYKRHKFDINEVGNNIKDAFTSISQLVSGQDKIKHGEAIVSGGSNPIVNEASKAPRDPPRDPTYNAARQPIEHKYNEVLLQSTKPSQESQYENWPARQPTQEELNKSHGYMEPGPGSQKTRTDIPNPNNSDAGYVEVGPKPTEAGYMEVNPNSPANDYLQINFPNNTEDPYGVPVPNQNYYSNSNLLYKNQTLAQDSGYANVGNNNNNENNITYSKKEQPPEYLTILPLKDISEIEKHIDTYYTSEEIINTVDKKLKELEKKYNQLYSNQGIALQYNDKKKTIEAISLIKNKIESLKTPNSKQQIDLLNKIYYNLIMLSIDYEYQDIKKIDNNNIEKDGKLKELYKKIEQNIPKLRQIRKGKDALQLYGLSSIVHHAKDDMEWFYDIEKVLFDNEEIELKKNQKKLNENHKKLKKTYKNEVGEDILPHISTHIENYNTSTLLQKQVENKLSRCENKNENKNHFEKCDQKTIDEFKKNKIKIDEHVKQTSILLIKSIISKIFKTAPDKASSFNMKHISDLTELQLKRLSKLLLDNLTVFMSETVSKTNVEKFEALSNFMSNEDAKQNNTKNNNNIFIILIDILNKRIKKYEEAAKAEEKRIAEKAEEAEKERIIEAAAEAAKAAKEAKAAEEAPKSSSASSTPESSKGEEVFKKTLQGLEEQIVDKKNILSNLKSDYENAKEKFKTSKNNKVNANGTENIKNKDKIYEEAQQNKFKILEEKRKIEKELKMLNEKMKEFNVKNYTPKRASSQSASSSASASATASTPTPTRASIQPTPTQSESAPASPTPNATTPTPTSNTRATAAEEAKATASPASPAPVAALATLSTPSAPSSAQPSSKAQAPTPSASSSASSASSSASSTPSSRPISISLNTTSVGGSRSKNSSKKILKKTQGNFIKKTLSFENKKSPKKFNMKELTKKHKKQNRIQTIKKKLKTNNKQTLYSIRSKKYQK